MQIIVYIVFQEAGYAKKKKKKARLFPDFFQRVSVVVAVIFVFWICRAF